MEFQLVLLLVVLSYTSADWNIQQHLASHTPYWSQGSITPSPAPPTCSLIHVDLVARHGARNPTSGDVIALSELAATVQNYSTYINNSYAWIKNWTNPFILDQHGFLSFSGQEELYQMGQRFNATYYPLFSQLYFPDVYVMQSTQVPRTGVSASSFAQGYLQGLGGLGQSHFQPTFFDNCDTYVEAMDNGTINENESDQYINQNYPAIAARVQEMLGVTGIWQISIETLESMLDACAFEVAVFGKIDGWCAIFSPSDISVYEYGSDLSDYWTKSYGSGLGYQIGAVVLQNVVEKMDGMIANSLPQQKAYLRFAHAETIIPLYAVLGLYKDNYTLTANLTQDQIDDRVWTTSVVSPFAGNLAFSLYSCGDGYRVKLTTNEVETPFPGCGGEIYCPYTTFTSLYSSSLSFNFTSSCALPPSPVNPSSGPISPTEFAVGVVVAFCIGGGVVFVGAVICILVE